MRTGKNSWQFLIAAHLTLLLAVSATAADFKEGEVIDATNWQKVEGMLPDSVLNWVKERGLSFKIAKFTWDYGWEKDFLDGSKANEGKFDVQPDGHLYEKSTGERPPYIWGFPFPTIDPNDPQAGTKIMWNKVQTNLKTGPLQLEVHVPVIGANGLERDIVLDSIQYFIYGMRDPLPNPDHVEYKEAIKGKSPSQFEGTILMTWRHMDNRPDSVWSYLPSFRRVRTLTASNRTDPLFGSDAVIDDSAIFQGKVESHTWKLVGERDVILLTNQGEPNLLVPGQKRGDGLQTWDLAPGSKKVVYGYEQSKIEVKDARMPLNLVGIVRPMYILEGEPKDPYYNYGRQIFYVDRETFLMHYKVVYDRAGQYWKTAAGDFVVWPNADRTRAFFGIGWELIADDKSHTGSASFIGDPYKFNTPMDPRMFTTAGLLAGGK